MRPTFPWAKPRREWLVLSLVAVCALAPVYELNAQDNSRLCLSQALAHGHLSNDGCFGLDRAFYKGHEYTDKAPGLSLVEAPLAEALRIPPANELPMHGWKVWVIRLLTSGIVFLGLALVVGRVAEGLAPGFGSIVLVTFALGTLFAPFAAANFDQVPAAALGFGSFLLAWRRKPLAAGLLAGTGVFFEYEAAAALVVVGAYVVFTTRSWRAAATYVAGALPGVLALGAYDWAAFGAPWRLSYRYVDNLYEPAQAGGLFGIHLPTLYATQQVFIGRGGLLVATPVLAAAAWGLGLLWRTHRAEVAVCVAITGIFLLLNCGYFLPYGGTPGPRFLLPAVPFLALGLGPAFARAPRITTVLSAVSIASMTAIFLDWGAQTPMKGGVFGEVARVPFQGESSRYLTHLEPTAFDWILPGRTAGAVLTAVAGLAAFIVAYRTIPRARRSVGAVPHRRWVTALGAGTVFLVIAAEASAVSGFPYAGPPRDLTVSIEPPSQRFFPGQEADFTVWSSNTSQYQGYGSVVLTIELPPGVTLLAPPSYERGSGCSGSGPTIVCNLDSLSPMMKTPVRLRVRPSQFGTETFEAQLSAQGLAHPRHASLSIDSG